MRDLYRLLLLCLFALSVLSEDTKAEETEAKGEGNFLQDNAQKIAYASLAVLATVFFIAKGLFGGGAVEQAPAEPKVGDKVLPEPKVGDKVSVQQGLKDDGQRYDATIEKVKTEGEGDKKVTKYQVKAAGGKGPKLEWVERARIQIKKKATKDGKAKAVTDESVYTTTRPLSTQQREANRLKKLTDQFAEDLAGIQRKEKRMTGVKQDKEPVSVAEATRIARAAIKEETDPEVRKRFTTAIDKLGKDQVAADLVAYKALDPKLQKLMETHPGGKILRVQALIGHRIECRGSSGLGSFWGKILKVEKDHFILHDGDYEDDSTPDKYFKLCWWDKEKKTKEQHSIRRKNQAAEEGKKEKAKSAAAAKQAAAAKAKEKAPKKAAKTTPPAAKPAAKTTVQSSS